MANTSMVYARVNTELKTEVESILKELGMTPSSLIQMLYSEIRLTRKIPLSLRLEPVKCIDDLTKEEFDAEIQKAVDDMNAGRYSTINEAKARIKKDLGLNDEL